MDREVTSDNQQESAEVGGPRDEGKGRDSGNTEVTKTRRIYVVVMWQKPTQHCKAIILLFKKNEDLLINKKHRIKRERS